MYLDKHAGFKDMRLLISECPKERRNISNLNLKSLIVKKNLFDGVVSFGEQISRKGYFDQMRWQNKCLYEIQYSNLPLDIEFIKYFELR